MLMNKQDRQSWIGDWKTHSMGDGPNTQWIQTNGASCPLCVLDGAALGPTRRVTSLHLLHESAFVKKTINCERINR